MLKIEEYKFGYMRINGKDYRNDLIIFKTRIMDNWWRKKGHLLCLEDLKGIPLNEIDYFIVGKGYSGMMEIDKEVINYFKKRDIDIFIDNTAESVKKYNSIESKNILAAFHLTC